METLLDAADALASNETPARPDFPIPADPSCHPKTEELLELRESPGKGKGWFARQNIAAGTVLLVAKPLAMAMDWQDDGEGGGGEAEGMEDEDEQQQGDNDKEPKLNLLLFLQLIKDIKNNPSVWTKALTELYPRNEAELQNLPKWICHNDEISMQVESLLRGLEKSLPMKDAAKEVYKRLLLIIRYNVLSVETCPELLSHPGPGGHASLGGVGLYHLPSFFNHNSRPNVSRYAVGDVMWFVANRDIQIGAEVCISYIEHDILCENSYRRNLMLHLDFEDHGENETTANALEDDGPDLPVVDSEVQNELMEMSSFERLNAIEELLQQAQGTPSPEEAMENDDEDGDAMMEPSSEAGWFQCDIQNLRILKAITLDGMGQTSDARTIWEECVDFTESQLPPLDESSVVMRVQAALCSLHLGEADRAKEHAQKALQTHNKLFGGGTARLRRRYEKDFQLSLRPAGGPIVPSDAAAVDLLWPL
jgi:hypothetical protein